NGCADLQGATGDTYAVQSGDAGGTLAVRVTATDAGGTASAESAPTAAVAAPPPPLAPPSSLAPPLVSGSATEGATLSASDGVWAGGSQLAFARRWQRCSAAGDACADVAGAVDARYALSAADVGSTLRVVVTASGGT